MQKWGDDGGGSLISPDGVAPIQMVGVSAHVIFPYNKKSKRAVKWLCVCDVN